MIKLNEQFAIRPFYDGWELIEYYEGKDKSGAPKIQTRKTYHANVRQVCNAAINKCAVGCGSLEELKALLESAGTILAERIDLISEIKTKSEPKKYNRCKSEH